MEENIQNSHLPVYNIKAVARLVGLLPVTLRAWERRYGLPSPQRGDHGYRLYSEYDLRILHWVKAQLEAGLSISRAVEYLNELRSTGEDPAQSRPVHHEQISGAISTMANGFREALQNFNDSSATEILRRAFTIYSVDSVLTEIIQPTLVELGEAWHRGDLPIMVEHFATQYCMQHLNSMLASSAPPIRAGVIVAACAPGEMHQIGLLSLVVMLRWRGWDVKYLGPDAKLEHLAEALTPLHPRILLFTATLPEAGKNLEQIDALLSRFPHPRPLIVLGGQAFQQFQLSNSLPVVYLHANPSDMVAAIEKLMDGSRPSSRNQN
jgi:MerR family transcriptional regulator, light-induced transcriptional regulator